MGRNSEYKLLRWLAVVPLFFAAAACSEYDSAENIHITAYGMAVGYNGGGDANYCLLQDDGATLYIKALLWDEYRYTNMQRVKFNYEIIDDPGGRYMAVSNKTYDIALYYISPVNECEPVMRSKADPLETGDDQLGGITRMFFSGDYLNVEYTLRNGSNNNISLVVDDAADGMDAADGTLTMEICHNAKGAALVHPKIHEVSFNIRKLVPEGKDSIRIRFVWKGQSKQVTGVYTPGAISNKPIAGSVENYSPSNYMGANMPGGTARR